MDINVDKWIEEIEKTEFTGQFGSFDSYEKLYLDCNSIVELVKVVGKDKLIDWLNQFETKYEKEAAISIVNKIKYYNSNDVSTLCRMNYCQWLIENEADVNKTIFIPLGKAGKSGNMLGYLFRMANDLNACNVYSEADIIQMRYELPKDINNVVFLDDYSGTGDQFINDSIVQEFINRCEESNRIITISFLPLVIEKEAKKRIEEKLRITVCSQQIRSKIQFNKAEKHIIDRYGKGLFIHKKKDLVYGWGECAETIVFFYNVPNNTLPIIWSDQYSPSIGKKWIPLFLRVTPKKNEDIEVINLLKIILEKEILISEDYLVYYKIFSEAYLEIVKQNFHLSFSEYKKYLFFCGVILRPFQSLVDVPTKHSFIVKLRKKILSLVEKCVLEDNMDAQELVSFFEVDYYVKDQGLLLIDDYSDILYRYIIVNDLEVVEFLNAADLEPSKGGYYVFDALGVIKVIYRILSERELSSREYDTLMKLRFCAKNNTMKYYIESLLAKCERRNPNYDDFNLSETQILVNCYGEYVINSVECAMSWHLF